MLSLLWLLLPVAAASGWYVAKHTQQRQLHESSKQSLSPEYFQGLNFLIDEQPDKAIDVFCQLVEENEEQALELHLALGNLFRKRGEVDRAIHLHQNLLKNPNLHSETKYIATVELAHDYLRSGLLDRAENLLLDLLSHDVKNSTVLDLLRKIYQQEKEWQKAIDTILKNDKVNVKHKTILAHYSCELALEAAKYRNFSTALSLLDQALKYDAKCVRANIIKGNIYVQSDNYERSFKAYMEIAKQNRIFLGEVVGEMRDCSHHLDNQHHLMQFLRENIKECPDLRCIEMLLSLLKEMGSETQASAFLVNYLKTSPSLPLLQNLFQLQGRDVQGELKDVYRLASDTLNDMLKKRSLYLCEDCGFRGRMLHWLCPGCKAWGSTVPICHTSGITNGHK